MASVRIARFRPHTQLRDGPARSKLITLAAAFAGESERVVESPQTFRFDPETIDLSDVAVYKSVLKELISKSDYLVVDLAYIRDVRAVFDLVFAQAFMSLSGEIRESRCVFLFLFEDHLSIYNRLMEVLAELPWNTRPLVLNSSGVTAPGDWAAPPRLVSTAALVTIEDKLDTLRRRMIRSRGVFEDPGTNGSVLSRFRFYGDFAGHILAQLFEEFFRSKSVEVAVFPQYSPSWFQNSLKAGAAAANVTLYTGDDLTGGSQSGQANGADAISNLASDRTVALVMPAYRSGHSFRQLRSAVEPLAQGTSFVNLAVLTQAAADRSHGEWPRRSSATGDQLFFLLETQPLGLERESWMFRLADSLNEIVRSPLDWIQPTKTAMWSVFQKLGFGLEAPYSDESRPQVSHFPNFARLEEIDAKWLAYSMLRLARVNQDDVLVVAPEEASGISHLISAFEESLDVATVQFSRSYISGQSDEDYSTELATIAAYTDRPILICDESTVSGATLRRLDSIIVRARGRGADAVTVVASADAGIDRRIRVLSLYEWRPLLLEDSIGVAQ
jgi:hypothetical protein